MKFITTLLVFFIVSAIAGFVASFCYNHIMLRFNLPPINLWEWIGLMAGFKILVACVAPTYTVKNPN